MFDISGSTMSMSTPEVFVYETEEVAMTKQPVLRRINIKIPEKFQSSLTMRLTPG